MSLSISDPIVWIIVGVGAIWLLTQLPKMRLKRATEDADVAEQKARQASADQTKRFADGDIHISVAPEVSKEQGLMKSELSGALQTNTRTLTESEAHRAAIANLRLQIEQWEGKPASSQRDGHITFLKDALVAQEAEYRARYAPKD